MRIPVPRTDLVTLALVGALLTATLTVGLANPGVVNDIRDDAASVLTDAADVAGTESADVVGPVRQTPERSTPAGSTSADRADSTPTTRPPVASVDTGTDGDGPTPSARDVTPTPVPNFTPAVGSTPDDDSGRTDAEYGEDDDHDDEYGEHDDEGGEHDEDGYEDDD